MGPTPPPQWLPVATLLLVALGIGLGTYLTITHYDKHALRCSDNGLVNCAKVTTSAQSRFLGLPVAELGLAYFIAMLPLMLPAAWRSQDRRIRLVRLGASAGGVAMVLWLISAELLIIRKICLYCTAVHVVTVLLFATVCVGTALTAPLTPRRR